MSHFSCLLLDKDFVCAYTGKSTCTRAFTEGFNNIDVLSMCMKKCHAKKILLLLNNCFSNLAMLYGFCILDISFFY